MRYAGLMTYVLGICLRKGGSGKTTTAVALAEAAAFGTSRVTLVDCDAQGSAYDWSMLAAASGRPLRSEVVRMPKPGELARRIPTLGADLVVIDAPPGNLDMAIDVIAASDFVVVPVPPQRADLARVPATAEIAREHGKPARAVLTLVRAGLAERDEAVAVLAAAGVPVFDTELPLTVAVQRNYGQGVTGVLARYGVDLMTEILKEAEQNG